MTPFCHEIFLQDHPSFIRFYTPDNHSEKVDIPKQFNENFNGNIPKNLTFKSLGGKAWEAEVEDIDGALHFAKGWEQYVKDNALKLGDVLMFKYLRNDSANFCVIAFDESGAIKDGPAEEKNDDDISSQSSEEKTDDDISSQSSEEKTEDDPNYDAQATKADSERESVGESMNDLVFVRDFKIKFKNSVGVPKRAVQACVLKLPQKVKLQYEMGIGVTTKLRQTKDRVVIRYNRLSKFWRANKTKVGDRLEFRLILGSENKIEKITVRKIGSVKKTSQRVAADNGDVGRQATDATDVHFTDAGTIKFYKTFKDKYKNLVHIPEPVIKACAITLPQTVKLTNDRGRGIEIPLRKAANRYILGYAGLVGFWRKNGVQEGHKLEFEVIRDNGDNIEQIILRNNKEHQLGRGY